jgi:DNA repair protein RadD
MAVKVPRDYQDWAHWSTWNYMHDPANFTGGVATGGKGPKYPLVVEATGLGKSLNIAMLIWHLSTTYPGTRILQTCHVKELVASNYEELLGMWPTAPAGVYAAALKRRDTQQDIIFAMINSVAKRAASFGKVDFILIDEAHRLSDNDKALYSQFIDYLRRVNPNLIVIGYTATDYRMKGGKLTDMGLFDDVVFDIGSGESFIWAVEQGYLILPVPTDPGFQLDESEIAISGGEYKSDDASAAMHEQDLIERAVDYSIAIAKEEGHRSAIAFAQSADDCDLIADMLTYKGYHTEAVHTRMTGDRDAILKAHKRGDIWGVASRDILTTGWNNPRVSLMMNLRLTRSPGLWVQMVGRMTRPNWTNHFFGLPSEPIQNELGQWNLAQQAGRLGSIMESGKVTSRVLDFCGNTSRLGPINYPFIPGKRKKGAGGEAPVRTCSIENTYDHYTEDHNKPHCSPGTIHHTSVKVCPHCGYEWPKASNLQIKASTSELVSKTNPLGLPKVEKVEKEYEVFSVHEMICHRNIGRGDKPDTMRVNYRCGNRQFPTWVCLEHPEKNYARKKAEEWWESHGGQLPAPTNIDEGIEQVAELVKPKFIKVWINTKFPEIVGYDFIGHKFEPIDLTDLTKERPIYEPEPDPLEKEREEAYQRAAYSSGGGYDSGYYEDDDIPF